MGQDECELIQVRFPGHAMPYDSMADTNLRTGYCMQVLGNIRASQGKWSESLKLHQDTLSLYRSAMGAKHRYTANALIKVVQHCLRLGQNVKAE
jgi:hypothetical protein